MTKLSDYLVSAILSMDEATIQNNISEYSKDVPEFITVNGEKIPSQQALARLITAEMSNGYKLDVVKAYTVAAYTCLKVIGNDFVLENVRISEAPNGVVKRAVEDVYGEFDCMMFPKTYEKFGFRVVGIRKKYYLGKDDAIIMTKYLE